MTMSFRDFLFLGQEFWLVQTKPAAALFYRFFGSLGMNIRIRSMRLVNELNRTDLNNKNILDVGCGKGYLLFYLARKYQNARLEGIDLDQNQIEQSQRLANKLAPGLHFRMVPIQSLPKTETYDFVFCSDVLEHVHDDVGMLVEMKTRIKEDGQILVHVPLRHQLQKRIFPIFKNHVIEDHVRDEYTPDEIKAKVNEAGLKIIEMKYGYNMLGELSMELNYLFWKVPALRNLVAIMTFPISIILGYLSGLREHNKSGNSLLLHLKK